MAFMGAAEVHKDKFGLLFDIVYADLSTDGDGVFPIARTRSAPRSAPRGDVTAAASYRVYETQRSFVDLYAGARPTTSISPSTPRSAP